MRVIGYARLSSASDESTSIARQTEAITQRAADKGWDLVRIIRDDVASASKLRLNRPGLDALRAAIANGEADAVLVWRLDRIARNVVDYGTLLDEGVNVVSATEDFDTTTPTGRAMAEIMQVFAGMEAKATAARVRDSVDYLRRNGRFPGGPVPYGYRTIPHPDGKGRALEIAPEEARVVREALERILGGETLYKVADDMTMRGIAARRADGWSIRVLSGILTGNAVLGRVTSRGEVLRDEHGVPAEVWAPIITADESAAIRALLAPKKMGRRRRKASRILSGLLYCSSCQRALTIQPAVTTTAKDGSTTKRAATYRCHSGGAARSCKGRVSINADRVEEYVLSDFLATVGRRQVVEEIVTAPEPVGLAEVEEAIQETARELAAPGADVAALAERMASLHSRRSHLAALPTEPVSKMVETGRTFAEEWEARQTMESRRLLLLSGIDHIVVEPNTRGKTFDPSRLRFHWNS